MVEFSKKLKPIFIDNSEYKDCKLETKYLNKALQG